MVIKNERNFCICWAFTRIDLRQCELFDLSRFTICQLKLLYKIFKQKWFWCAKGGVFCKWIFPISNVYKNTSKYLLLVECRFEMDIHTCTVQCPNTEFCVIGSGWTVYFYINISSLYIYIYIFTHIHTLYTQMFVNTKKDSRIFNIWINLTVHSYESIWPN